LDRGLQTGHQRRACRHALGRDDVATLAVGVLDQGQVRGTVRIVFQPLDHARHAILVALEIDHAVALLVTAAHVASRDATRIVATAGTVLLLDRAGKRLALLQVRVRHLDAVTARRGGRFGFLNRHGSRPSRVCRAAYSVPAPKSNSSIFWPGASRT